MLYSFLSFLICESCAAFFEFSPGLFRDIHIYYCDRRWRLTNSFRVVCELQKKMDPRDGSCYVNLLRRNFEPWSACGNEVVSRNQPRKAKSANTVGCSLVYQATDP